MQSSAVLFSAEQRRALQYISLLFHIERSISGSPRYSVAFSAVSRTAEYSTVYSGNYTVVSLHSIVESVQCTVFIIGCTLYRVECKVYSVEHTVYSVQRTVYII